jgi:ribosomal protein S12 methylthiotransferase accessory factor
MSLKEKILQSSKKVFSDKAAAPEETIKLVEERLKKSGLRLYQGLKRVDKGRLGIPVYMSLYDIEGQRLTGKFKQMGKGVTPLLAKASALMELVERVSLFQFLKEVPKRGVLTSFEELSDKAMSFDDFLFSIEDEEPELREVAVELLRSTPFYFVSSLWLAEEKEVLFPFHWFWMLYEYNGSSAGNTYAECSVQALCEVIERHASALFIRKSEPLPEVVLDDLSEEAKELLDKFLRLGIKLWIRDMTLGMPVPTIGVMAMDPSTFPERSEIVFTAGTATSPERALIRALTEIAQLAGDFDTEGKYEESGLPKYASLEEAALVVKSKEKHRLSELPDISSGDHLDEIRSLAEGLKSKGFQGYLIDVTSPSLEIPAVYACIPGALFRDRTKISYLYQLSRCVANFLPLKLKLEILEELCSKVKDRYYLWAYLGNAYKEKSAFKEAEEAYQKALSLEAPKEDLVAIYTHLADLYAKREEFEKVIAVVEAGLSLKEAPELYNLLGRAFYKKGDYHRAMGCFLKATELNPASAVDYANVGYCLKSLGLLPAAEVYFRKALLLDPDLTMAKRGVEYCKRVLHSEN